MMNKTKRMFAVLAATAAMALGLGSAAAPAQAAASDCPAGGYICLFQWINYGSGRWQQDFLTLYQLEEGCWNLSGSRFNNGAVITDKAASLVLTERHINFGKYYVEIFDWVDCQYQGGYHTMYSYIPQTIPNLTSINFLSNTAYHRITSIGVTRIPS